MTAFHRKCGKRISLTNGNRTAMRSISDFNQGLVLSAEPLRNDVIFEVRIDEKNHSWSGSIEIGVTACDPQVIELPSCATKLKQGTWVMSGISVLKDGISLIEFYGTDLDSLVEGDQVGVLISSQNELIFYINGESQGVAATNIPSKMYALINLYGRCVQVSICPSDSLEYSIVSEIQNIDVPTSFEVANHNASPLTLSSNQIGDFTDVNDRLRFHARCGSLVKLSPNCRTAERRRPLDEFNNGVVMTHRPLKDNEFFEIRIDKLVDKWSGSIEVGVTTHNPSALHFPATMTNMRSGTIMMSGCGILTNGKGTRRQYGEFNLDELREGDRVGMMRKNNSNLHYYINGQDQGIAATRVAQTLWGVIDLYGMTIKVTIVDRDEREEQNLVTRRNNIVSIQRNNNSCTPLANSDIFVLNSSIIDLGIQSNSDRITFHPICGSHCLVTPNGRTAQRKNASDDFNNGVVLTRRPLKSNELFQVRLEKVVTKWAGSIEIGVTTHSATELEFPFTMTNVRSGTWMMTGNGVMHNGTTVIEQYGQNLDRLQVDDRVGVMRKEDGTLHFWVNNIDQGPAATNVPEHVFGVIDLYGQAAQATIIEEDECGSPDTINSTVSNTTLYSEPPLRFHRIHGKNARITNGGLTASRPKALAEFNDAIIFSNRPLRNGELFEVVLERMVVYWSGNIEIGVTGHRPEEIQLTGNATGLECDAIILCGSAVFHNDKTILNNVPFDLDTLAQGARVGVMRNGDSIHFFVNGIDQGPTVEYPTQNMQYLWAVIDLYGQCAQVSLTSQPELRAPYAISENSQSFQGNSVLPSIEAKHRWTCISGNVTLSANWSIASRLTGTSAALSKCLIFSEHPLSVGSPFEITITSYNPLFAGCLNIGVTDLNLNDENVRKNIPNSLKRIPANVWYVSNNEVRHNSVLLQKSLASLSWLRAGDRISLELTAMGSLRILLNSENVNINFTNISINVYVVAELQGSTMAVQAVSSQGPVSPLRPCTLRLQDSLELGIDPLNKQDSMLDSLDAEYFEFCEFHGRNIKLLEDRRSAQRVKSYNNALVYFSKPLCKGHSAYVRVDSVNYKWQGTIGIGAIAFNNFACPSSVILLNKSCWIATSEHVNINGNSVASKYGQVLENIEVDTVITISLSHSGDLSLIVGDIHLGELATGLPNHIYLVFDLYGKCEKISIVNNENRNGTPIIEEEEAYLNNDRLHENDPNVPQCEKANLEVHEKETELTSLRESNNDIHLPAYINHKTEFENENNNVVSSTIGICLQESLQIQHNTNINIQRSQSTQRFYNSNNSFSNDNTELTQILPTNLEVNSISTSSCCIPLNNPTPTTSTNSIANIRNIEETNNNSVAEALNSLAIDEICKSSSEMQISFNTIFNYRTKDCEYLKLVCGFKNSLVLPDAYFQLSKQPMCFCVNCVVGELPRPNSNLINWVYYKLNTETLQASGSQSSFDLANWVKLYYETRVDKIRQILDHGQPIGTETLSDSTTCGNKLEESGIKLILRSFPVTSAINSPHSYTQNNSKYSIYTAFEVLTRKQAISSIAESEQKKSNLNGQSSNDDSASSSQCNSTVFTKEAGACLLSGLLLKLELVNDNFEEIY